MATFEILTESVPPSMAMGATAQPRLKDGQPKLSPTGQPTFTSGVVVARPDGGADRGLTIAIIEPPKNPWPMGTLLKADGRCWLVPYVDGSGRQAISFTVERLVPVSSSSGNTARAKDGE